MLSVCSVSKAVYVVDSSTDFSKFMAGRAGNWSSDKRVMMEDDGRARSLNESRILDNNSYNCVCECECPSADCDQSSEEKPEIETPSEEAEKCPEQVPALNEFVSKVEQLRPNTLYCIVSRMANKPVHINVQNDVYQFVQLDCDKATPFLLKEYKSDDKSVTAKLFMNKYSKFIQPEGNRIKGRLSDSDDDSYRWTIVLYGGPGMNLATSTFRTSNIRGTWASPATRRSGTIS